MEQTKNMEQAGEASVVSTEKKNESRKRDANGKDVLAIRSFLESLNVYEADALRVGIAIADGKTTAANISADDRLALNRYFNSGKDNERMTTDNAQEHRLNRAFQLLERVAEFCDKRQLVTVNRSLLSSPWTQRTSAVPFHPLTSVLQQANRSQTTQAPAV